MVSRVACFFTLGLVSAFLIISMDARSWDIAVTIGPHIDFYSRNGTKTGRSNINGAVSLTGLAYNSLTKTMYVSDKGNANVFAYNKNQNETEFTSNLFERFETDSYKHITDIVFDPVTSTLFWINSYPGALMMLEVDENASQPNKLHDLKGLQPWGLALDICNRYIYWTNSNRTKPGIERSNLDGSDRRVIVKDELTQPYGITVDHEDGKLYWTDDREGIHFRIGRSNLDGTGYEEVLQDTRDKPYYIAVDGETVYWSNQNSNSIEKINKYTEDKRIMFQSYDTSNPSADQSDIISGIITRDNTDVNCKAISEKPKIRVKDYNTSPIPHPSPVETNDATNTEKTNSISQPEMKCLNEGVYDEIAITCRCRKGFTGDHCERYVCDGYCLNKGVCSVSSSDSGQSIALCRCENGFTGPQCERNVCDGYCLNNGTCLASSRGSDQPIPSCRCKEGFTGPNCEHNVCDGHCLNNGTCSVSSTGEPSCKCDNFRGSHCEYSIELDTLCSLYCMRTEDMLNTLNISFCGCGEGMELIPGHIIHDTELGTQSTIILSVLITFIGVLIIIIGALSYHVHKLRRRPRIRKRFVVSKGGVTPLTSRPQGPTDSCEITIENCCNMNICETPCFEPKLRTQPSKTNNTKREEINSLLDSMEGADSC